MLKHCIYCGKEIHESAIFCHACGKKQPDNSTNGDAYVPQTQGYYNASFTTQDTYLSSEDKPNESKKTFITKLIRNSILLIVAITLFALSFAPVLKTEYPEDMYGLDIDLSASFSTVDGIVFLFDSMIDMSSEDISDSRLYNTFSDLVEEVEKELDKVTDSDGIDREAVPERTKQKIEKLIVVLYRLGLQGEDIKTDFSHVTIAIASLLYVLSTAAFLVLAVFNFISSFGLLKKFETKIYKATLSLLAAVPSLVFVLYMSFYAFMGDGIVSMASGAVASLTISFSAITAIIVLAFIFKWHEQKFNIPLRSVAGALALLVICMCFTPIYTTTIDTVFENRTNSREANIPVCVSICNTFVFSEDELEYIDALADYSKEEKINYFNEIFSRFGDYTKAEVEEGYAQGINIRFLSELLACKTEYKFIFTFISLIPMLFVLTVFFAGMVLQQNLICLIRGRYSFAQTMIGKILATILAILAIAAAIALLVSLSIVIYNYGPIGYSIAIGAGPIMLGIFAIACCCIPAKIKTKK